LAAIWQRKQASEEKARLAKPQNCFFASAVCALSRQHTGLIIRFAAKDDCIADSELNIVRHRT
jgi:hypothetical protein